MSKVSIVKDSMVLKHTIKAIWPKFRLTHFMQLASFDTPWKHQKTIGFLMFSGGAERDQLHEMN